MWLRCFRSIVVDLPFCNLQTQRLTSDRKGITRTGGTLGLEARGSCRMLAMILQSGSANVFCKKKKVTILGFAGHTVCCNIQLHNDSMNVGSGWE